MGFPLYAGTLRAEKTSLSKADGFLLDVTGTSGQVTVSLKEGTDVLNPVFILSSGLSSSDIFTWNYCYCPKMGNRFYYITAIRVLNNNQYELHCHVDVIATYKSDILNATGFCTLSGEGYNTSDPEQNQCKFIEDNRFPTIGAPTVIYRPFTGGELCTLNDVDNPNNMYQIVIATL